MYNFIIKTLFILSLFFYSSYASANISSFDINVTPTTAKVWETLNITITALDRDWNVFEWYNGSILIFSQDEWAEFPWELSWNIYDFSPSDWWVARFENAVRFSREWIQDINVYDLENEDVFWYTEVEVTSENVTRDEEITILSPSSWTTIPRSEVKISWETASNHLISLIINWEREENVISNSSWVFELNIKDLKDWENFIIAHVLDDQENIIWTSKEIILNIQASAPRFTWIKLEWFESKDWIYKNEEIVWVEVQATQWLDSVNMRINWVLFTLEEKENWVYVWDFTTPNEQWEYNIELVLVNDLWVETKENAAISFKVEKEESVLDEIIEEKEPEIKEEPKEDETKLELESAAENMSCEDLKKWLEIKNIKLDTLRTKSIISWDPINKATSYNVYKKDSSWDMVFVKNVSEPRVVIDITWDEVKYEEFAIKWFIKRDDCEVESASFSEMTKVQTWPELIAILLLSLLWWFLFSKYSRRKS